MSGVGSYKYYYLRIAYSHHRFCGYSSVLILGPCGLYQVIVDSVNSHISYCIFCLIYDRNVMSFRFTAQL